MKQSVKLILLAVLFCAYCTKGQDEEATDPGSDELFGNGTNQADGHRAGRIVKGSATTIAAYPFVVSVITLFYGFNYYYAGTVIGSTRVLCSASINGDPVNVRAGSNYQTKDGTVFSIISFVKHPSYVASTRDNNVAIITIQGTFDGVPNVQPITVSYTPLVPSAPNLANCFLVGWGVTESYGQSDTLKKAEFKLVADATCSSSFPTLAASTQCAQSVSGYGCDNDEGSPLVCNNQVYGTFIETSCNPGGTQTYNKFTKMPVASIQSFLSPSVPVPSTPVTQRRKNYVSCP